MRVLSSIILAVLVASCTLMPADAPSYAPAPLPSAGLSNIYIYRLNAYPVLHNPMVVVDGAEIIDPPEKAYTVIQLPPGEHEVEVNWSFLAGWPDLKFNIVVTPNEPFFLRIGGAVFESRATMVSRNVGEAELTDCCRYIAPRERK